MNRVSIIAERFIFIAGISEGVSSIIVDDSQLWAEPKRLRVVLDGVIVVFLTIVGEATIVVGLGRIRIQSNRFVEGVDRRIVVSAVVRAHAAVKIGGRTIDTFRGGRHWGWLRSQLRSCGKEDAP